jgi:hypothetical protein
MQQPAAASLYVKLHPTPETGLAAGVNRITRTGSLYETLKPILQLAGIVNPEIGAGVRIWASDPAAADQSTHSWLVDSNTPWSVMEGDEWVHDGTTPEKFIILG